MSGADAVQVNRFEPLSVRTKTETRQLVLRDV
jgi:hypothetical protein